VRSARRGGAASGPGPRRRRRRRALPLRGTRRAADAAGRAGAGGDPGRSTVTAISVMPVVPVVVVVVVVPAVRAAAVGGVGACRVLGGVVLLGAGEVLHGGGEGVLGAVLELEDQLHLVAREQGRGEVHEHEVMAAGFEHQLLTGGEREPA